MFPSRALQTRAQAWARIMGIGCALQIALITLSFSAVSASADTGRAQWAVTSVSRPTNFSPGDETGDDSYIVLVTNTGDAASEGPVTVTDELPPGISFDVAGASGEDGLAVAHKSPASAGFTCVPNDCTYSGSVVPGDTLTIKFSVDVRSNAAPVETNVVRVSGGGAPDAQMSTPTTISSTSAGFGISAGGAAAALSSTQAGAHPDFATLLAFNTVNPRGSLAGDLKDTTAELPPGFAGDLTDMPVCQGATFLQEECPVNSQVGIISIATVGSQTALEPVYNLVPDPGALAKLGFAIPRVFHFEGDVSLRPGDYGLTTTFANANEIFTEVDGVSLTVWGVPTAKIHDPLRWKSSSTAGVGEFGASVEAGSAPFFTNPTSCPETPLEERIRVSSWQEPTNPIDSGPVHFGSIGGCDRLGMDPSLTAELTTSKAYSPSGLNLNMSIPQTYDNPSGLATSTLKRAVVALPEGVTVNPSAGAGVGACAEAQFNEEPIQQTPGVGCPDNSKLGTVKIESPAIREPVEGSVFLAQPYANRFGSLLALYIVARIPNRGVLVRSAGEVKADLTTGRLVTTFDDLPPLPFNQLLFKFIQGQTSPLVSPSGCGEYAVRAELTPASAPEANPLVPVIRPFPISSAFDGGPCPAGGTAPFAPQVLAGTQTNEAGTYSPMYIRVLRNDGEQEITRFSAQLPAGLTANLTGVPFCSDVAIALARLRTGAQEEAQPSCPAASQIGHTLVGAGVGSVLAQAPGRVYMAGPYNGAPFSIVAITSAKVGPFDLGTVVVREALKIDPTTALVTVDATASDPIPHIIDGIVVHVRDIRVYVDRPSFSLEPTSCEHMRFAVTVSGSGADFVSPTDDVPVTVDDPFQVADCQALRFKPGFKASTSGKTSRTRGASLSVKLTYPKAPQGTQANIRSVKVDLPKQLPSRLSTLQKACPDTTFEANPASCPGGSKVGVASAITPILPVPLVGPAYFVSHGGAKFPELIIVLQGYGVTIDLHGETFISKAGITSSTFRSVPDQPVSSFQLTLPRGSNSALAANGNLCKIKLKMPTAFTAQNGAVLHQSTPISVSGCPKAKKPKRKPGKKRISKTN
jgi:uncharacterized repeat protein (TIGR01451 family)